MLRSALGRRALAAPLPARVLSGNKSVGGWRALSSRQAALLETQVMEQMRTIQDGLGLGDIASLGRVKVRVFTLKLDACVLLSVLTAVWWLLIGRTCA